MNIKPLGSRTAVTKPKKPAFILNTSHVIVELKSRDGVTTGGSTTTLKKENVD